MYWIFLIVAGLLEIVWATTLKLSAGFSKTFYGLITIVFMIGSFLLLALALKKLPMGIAYAVWTGIGITGTFLVGTFLFREPMNISQGICVLLILLGIVGLKIF